MNSETEQLFIHSTWSTFHSAGPQIPSPWRPWPSWRRALQPCALAIICHFLNRAAGGGNLIYKGKLYCTDIWNRIECCWELKSFFVVVVCSSRSSALWVSFTLHCGEYQMVLRQSHTQIHWHKYKYKHTEYKYIDANTNTNTNATRSQRKS